MIGLPAQHTPHHPPEASLAAAAVHELRAPPGHVSHAAFAILALARQPAAPIPVLWVATAQNAYPPGIAWLGLDPGRILFAQAATDDESLASLEAALRGGMAGIAEVKRLTRLAARRLSLAARQGGGIGFLLRHAPRQTAQDSTSFATRWFIQPAPGGLRAELLYAKGACPKRFLLQTKEVFDDAAPSALTLAAGRAEPERRAS
jgi:protein ImuA